MSIPYMVSCLSHRTLQTLPMEMTNWSRASMLRSDQADEEVLRHLTAKVIAVPPAAVRLMPLEVVKLKLGGVNETESAGWRLRGCAAGCEFVYHAWWYVIGVCWV